MRYFFGGMIIFLTMISHPCLQAQYQLVLVNGNSAVNRYRVGEPFRTKLKSDRSEHWGLILEISEFQVLTSQDTINISDVRKVLVPGRPLINKIGKTLVVVGVAYMFIDQFNWVLIEHNKPSMDERVWKPAAVFIGAGIPLLFFKKKWTKIKRGTHLIAANRKSKFYTEE